MPVLRAKKALRTVPIGGTVRLDCTDPLSTIDIPHFVAEAGHELADTTVRGSLLSFCIVRRR